MPIQSRLTGLKAKTPIFHRIIFLTLIILILVALVVAYLLYISVFSPNVFTSGSEQASILIPTGSTYADVKNTLISGRFLRNQRSFEWVSRKKNYPSLVKPGHYVLRNGMNNNDLLNMLRSGEQTPVNIVFHNIRTIQQLAGKISLQIEADSSSLINSWQDRVFLKTLGFSPENVFTLFIPNTYEIWWNSDSHEFTTRMAREYHRFWDGSRKAKAGLLGMSIPDIVILASIVEKETEQNDEKPLIAGVYINRLKNGWPLQADPTLKFALGNFEIRRILNIHKEVDSPYNTYKQNGLPPGPICLPSIASIDAVLDHRKHQYMYFCAKSDMSGYHAFARTLAEHNRNAKAYQQALDKLNIR